MKNITLILLLVFSSSAFADKLNVLACEPEWAALAYALGGEVMNIHSATTHMQDPHHIQARPSLIAKARKADLLICSGAELEAGWLPLLLRKSNNAAIQAGASGHFMAAEQVTLLEQNAAADRSHGDVHQAGNPHVHFDPHRMLTIAEALLVTLQDIAPEHAEAFQANFVTFKSSILKQLEQLSRPIEALKGTAVVVHHGSWVYFREWLGIHKVAELEPKPGLPPSSGHLNTVLASLEGKNVTAIIYSSYQSSKAASWLSKRSGIPSVVMPYSVDNWQDASALPQFYATLVNQLYQAVASQASQTRGK